jgi:hypothetical protein
VSREIVEALLDSVILDRAGSARRFLFGAVMTVLGGIGAFSFHIWRHGRMPAEPYQELSDEDLSRYE